MARKSEKKNEKGQKGQVPKKGSVSVKVNSQKKKKKNPSHNITSLEEKMNEKTEQMKLPGRKQTQLNPAKTKRMILLVFVVLLIFIVIRGGFEIISLNKQEKQIEQELAAKKAEMEKLEKKREYMSSEAYIEQTARDMLKMIRPGEILYVMKENGEDKSNSDTKDKENSKDDGDKGEAGGED